EVRRLAARDRIVLIRDEALEARERAQIERLAAFEIAHPAEAIAELTERRHDAVELEVFIAPRTIAVIVVRELAAREREVGLAIGVRDRLLALVRTLGE